MALSDTVSSLNEWTLCLVVKVTRWTKIENSRLSLSKFAVYTNKKQDRIHLPIFHLHKLHPSTIMQNTTKLFARFSQNLPRFVFYFKMYSHLLYPFVYLFIIFLAMPLKWCFFLKGLFIFKGKVCPRLRAGIIFKWKDSNHRLIFLEAAKQNV